MCSDVIASNFLPLFINLMEDLKSLAWLAIQTADIDEKGIRREKPEDLVMALAEAKV